MGFVILIRLFNCGFYTSNYSPGEIDPEIAMHA